MLSSDVLEQQFGQTRVVVHKQTQEYRVITTIANKDNKILELSLVEFDASGIGYYPKIHNQIVGGVSMGKAFRAGGVSFVRRTKAAGKLNIPGSLQKILNSPDEPTAVEVSIFVGNDAIHYADILEIYSSDVVWPGEKIPHSDGIQQRLRDFASLL